jgi:L-asparaginase
MDESPERENDDIYHLATGGTVDSEWDPAADTAVPSTYTIVPHYLNKVARISANVRSKVMFLKDSRKVNFDDQDAVANEVAETTADRILGTSGTFLMPDIVMRIAQHPMAKLFEEFGKRIVLTGALIPLREYIMSDAGFSLGMSVAVLQEELRERFLLVMNGSCFDGRNVRKDTSNAYFGSSDGRDVLPYDGFTLIPAGGSVDFVPDGLDRLVPARESFVPDFLRRKVKINRQFYSSTPFTKDSRELSDKDKETIVKIIKESSHDHILITLGIYKVREIQKYLREELGDALNDKVIVLTGSRVPLSLTDKTDASFNIGYALGKIGFLPPGVHVGFAGKILNDDDDVMSTVYTPEEIEILKGMNT